jgi:hypothetical protein
MQYQPRSDRLAGLRWNMRGFRCIIDREYVRLFTAIPLLFWVGTAAVAHLAHVWALVPAAVTPVAQAPEAGCDASADQSVCTAASPLFVQGESACRQYLPASLARGTQLLSGVPELPSRLLHHQILSAARLSANPPPQRA